jgi:hypothetical protein
MVAFNLTHALRSPKPLGDAARTISLRGSLTGVLCILLLQITLSEKTYSISPIDHYKLYAHSIVVNAKEYRCLELLWNKESNWNHKAKNKKSSAFGIPQLLNMKTTDPIEQINQGYKYIQARYTTPCNAWAFFKSKGYY